MKTARMALTRSIEQTSKVLQAKKGLIFLATAMVCALDRDYVKALNGAACDWNSSREDAEERASGSQCADFGD